MWLKKLSFCILITWKSYGLTNSRYRNKLNKCTIRLDINSYSLYSLIQSMVEVDGNFVTSRGPGTAVDLYLYLYLVYGWGWW